MKVINNTDKRVFVRYNPNNGDRVTIVQIGAKDSGHTSEFEIEDTDTLYIQTIKEVDEK